MLIWRIVIRRSFPAVRNSVWRLHARWLWEPQILLLDEPFGALDAQVRKELRRWLRQLHEELKFTSVFVTHDQEEATEVADRVVVMSQGNIEQADAPDQVWREPATRLVLEFMERGKPPAGEPFAAGSSTLAHIAGRWDTPPRIRGPVDLFLRPWKWISAAVPASIRRYPYRYWKPARGHYTQLVVQPLGGTTNR